MMATALQAYAKRLKRIAAQRWAPTLVFLLLATFIEGSRSWAFRYSWWPAFATDGYPLAIVSGGAAAVGAMIVAALPFRGWRLALATVVTTVLCVGVVVWLLFRLTGGTYEPVASGLIVSNAAFALRSFWSNTMAGLVFAAFCLAREREAELLAAARSAELERASAQRALLESRLQVLQAQIDPALLFDGLADVHRLYRTDTSAAVTRLDELIAYLRAALPKLRPSSGTGLS